MITLVEPQKHIAELWGKQKVIEQATYRLMHYVFRVDYDKKVHLHNFVTGEQVILEQEETELVDKLPALYRPEMEQMVTNHYLVPEDSDEHQQVSNLRQIIRKLADVQRPKNITHYTILTTTACNARCYYCFEQGIKTVTMSEQTANDVVDYIATNCSKNEKVHISWFGGEPTVVTYRIDQICSGLQEKRVDFWSDITTNAYLFDADMVYRARKLWNLQSANISMDGIGERYNNIKAYVNPTENPYQRVLRNAGLLLQEGIRVNIRMNFDVNNYSDFEGLLHDIQERYGDSPLLNVYAHQINGEYSNDGIHGSEEWFAEKIVELNSLAREHGLYRKSLHPWALISIGCKAAMDSTVTITPEGNLVRCPEQLGEDQITGTVKEGVTNEELVQSWKQLVDFAMCEDCCYYPICLKVLNCTAKERCIYKREYDALYREETIKIYNASL